ncbi:hypothetical protein TRVL_08002 [Trypanosoma vivax]|nr:hypothetical protein TRVL_08002 [Trypanosoma vivax]
MLHERYTPRDLKSVAWSTQKVKELMNLISDMRNGRRLPHIVLLHGPTGCGKLSSLLAVLGEQSSSNEAGLPRTRVLHMNEAVPWDYYKFLVGTFSQGSSAVQENGESFQSNAELMHVARPGTVSNNATSDARMHYPSSHRIVKFYGDPLNSEQQRLTRLFLDQFEKMRNTAIHSMGDADPQTAEQNSSSVLRRNLLFFIVTTHDSHSGNLVLRKLLPSFIFTHSCVYLFHCPQLTTRNMMKRIKEVLTFEQGRCPHQLPLSEEEIKVLCEHSHGDIRHALLQTEWCLLRDADKVHHAPRGDPKVSNRKRRRSDADTPTNIFYLLKSIVPDTLPEGREVPSESNIVAEENLDACSDAPPSSATKLFRDEYLDLSHATARILTQKYSVSSVAEKLNAEPAKLVGYLTNNMLSYFLPEQMDECSACVSAASHADAMRATVVFSRWRKGRSVLHTTRLTSEDENEGSGSMGLDLMSLYIFGKAYFVYHKNVYVPKTFDAKRPPPYYSFPFPRVREVQPKEGWLRSGIKSRGEYVTHFQDWGGDHTHDLFPTEQGWRDDFKQRLLGVSGKTPEFGSYMDIVRECLPALIDRCGPLDAVLLEYLPYARYIVLDHAPPTCTASSCPHTSTDKKFLEGSNTSCTWARVNPIATKKTSGPTRTWFSVPTPTAPPTQKRPCSQLQHDVLCLGLPGKLPLREEMFFLADAGELFYNTAAEHVHEASGHQSIIPLSLSAEDIEDFSD